MIKFGQRVGRKNLARLPKLIQVIQRQSDIVAVYLFGSFARGNPTPLSDIDIAILLNKLPPPGKYLDRELELLGMLNETLKTDEVGFVLLNKAPLVIQFGVLQDGKVIYSKDDAQRIEFENVVTMEYLDFAPLLKEYDQELFSSASITQ